MINADKIRGLMREKKRTQEDIADKLSISTNTLRNKLESGKFYVDEIQILIKELDIGNPEAYFFCK